MALLIDILFIAVIITLRVWQGGSFVERRRAAIDESEPYLSECFTDILAEI